jgi:hypothetical protein
LYAIIGHYKMLSNLWQCVMLALDPQVGEFPLPREAAGAFF